MTRWCLRHIWLVALIPAIPFLIWNGFVQQMDAEWNDILFRLRGPVASRAAAQIVLLAIDDRTAALYGPLPLARSRLAEGLEKLAALQPRVLAIDLLLSEPAAGDARLAQVLPRFPRLVLSAAIESDSVAHPKWIGPAPALRGSGRVAHVHAAPDADGVVRSVLLAKAAEDRRLWALGLEAACFAMGADRPLETPDFVHAGAAAIPAESAESRLMPINYAGPEGTFPRVSFASLLEGRVDPALFHDKIVILGVTAQGSGDRLFVPLSHGLGMSGIEIHANIVRTILDRAFLARMPVAGELAGCLLIAALCIFAVEKSRGSRLVLCLSAIAIAIPLGSAAALRFGSIWPAAGFFGIFLVSSGIAGAGEYALVTIALRDSERKRRDYAFRVQAIAHEIKTPLTAIQGSSEMIAEKLVPEEQKAEMAGLIHKESKRLTEIIHTFLDVERMAAGTLNIRRQPTSLEELCGEVLERARLYAVRKKIAIQSEVPALTLEADADLLSFALYNLLTNAVKYSPRNTTVLLRASCEGGTVCISVTDQGHGITPEEQNRIFEPFYRAKRDRTGEEEGSGIGLALVKEIVAQHGGRILVESMPGEGSRFTMLLPKGTS